jgi:RHS repeat-associated protein
MDYYDPIAITDNSGAIQERFSYSAFGLVYFQEDDFTQKSGSAFDWIFLYHGQFRDNEIGWDNYGYRYYLPLLGRWSSRDPIEEKGGLNLYRFTKNEPVSSIDLFGLMTIMKPIARNLSKKMGNKMGNKVGGLRDDGYVEFSCVLEREERILDAFGCCAQKTCVYRCSGGHHISEFRQPGMEREEIECEASCPQYTSHSEYSVPFEGPIQQIDSTSSSDFTEA